MALVVRVQKASSHGCVPLLLETTWRYQYESRSDARNSCVPFHIGDQCTCPMGIAYKLPDNLLQETHTSFAQEYVDAGDGSLRCSVSLSCEQNARHCVIFRCELKRDGC